MDLIDIFRTLHSHAKEYTFFSTAHGAFYRIDHILGHKSNISKFQRIEIISNIFSDRKCYETRYQLQEKKLKNTNTCRLNNTLLNNKEVTEEIRKLIKRFLETNDNENTTTQNLWHACDAA